MNLTYQDIKANKEINQYITMGNEILGVLGYTDHSQKITKPCFTGVRKSLLYDGFFFF